MVVSCWSVSPSRLSLLCPPLSSLSCVSPSLEQPPARPHLSLRPSSLPWWRSENNPLYHTQGLWWIGRSWGGWGGGASMPSAATRGRWEPQPEQVKTIVSTKNLVFTTIKSTTAILISSSPYHLNSHQWTNRLKRPDLPTIDAERKCAATNNRLLGRMWLAHKASHTSLQSEDLFCNHGAISKYLWTQKPLCCQMSML